MSTRDAIRAATVGSSANFKKKMVEFNGVEVEVREVSPGVREKIRKKAQSRVISNKDGTQEIQLNAAEYTAHSIIEACYVPGTDEKVFEPADLKTILNSSASGYYKVLGDAASELMNEAEEEGNE